MLFRQEQYVNKLKLNVAQVPSFSCEKGNWNILDLSVIVRSRMPDCRFRGQAPVYLPPFQNFTRPTLLQFTHGTSEYVKGLGFW